MCQVTTEMGLEIEPIGLLLELVGFGPGAEPLGNHLGPGIDPLGFGPNLESSAGPHLEPIGHRSMFR